jgi:hypothetical protein
MTAADLLADLKTRGVVVSVADGSLRVQASRGVLTTADRAALIEHKPALLTLLRADEELTYDVPDGPCQLCGAPLAWIEDWPTACAHRWLCLACADRPAPTLPEVYATLTAEERQRLEAEAAAGDDLARAALNELTATDRRQP